MNITDLQMQFVESPCLRLLRAENAPLVLATLFAAFKREHASAVPESRLRAILEAELEEARDTEESAVGKKAGEYLIEWADQAHGYLRRYQPDGADEPIFELTPELEQVFHWLESLKPRTHVGTESKFKNLASVLEEIVVNSTRDPDVRIQRLKEEQLKLQKQIEEIERTGEATVYSATQVNERFVAVLETARNLLGDFREVERHFRRVTENIAVQQSTAGATRGSIVGQTLDAQDQLRLSSQGQSFYAFWDFLLAPERRRQFTELVEEAVLAEFDRLTERGGVVGAMETQYQRGKIQDESLYYEELKHNGELPLVGINTFLNPKPREVKTTVQLARSNKEEKDARIAKIRQFQSNHEGTAPFALEKLKRTALEGKNTFNELMETVQHCTLGQISAALYEVGGQYRRNV